MSADVGGFPFLPSLLLNGEVSQASVHLENITAGVLVFARVDLELRGVILDRSVLFSDQKARITDIRKGVVTAEIEQGAIERIIRVPVVMKEGKVFLTIASREVQVTPTISAEGQLSLQGAGIGRTFSLKIPTTDYVPCVGRVEILAGRMRLSCEIDEVPPALVDAVQDASA